MKKIAIVGGKLQGLEVCYLGKKAGMEVILIDREENPPAKNLCSRFIRGDVVARNPQVLEILSSVDMVLPTLENDKVLEELGKLSKEMGFIYAFDPEAYRISSSKLLSDRFFHDNNIPFPRYYPKGDAPYIVKPDSGSGSDGVGRFNSKEELEEFLSSQTEEMIVQEYLEGPSYSIEVIGVPGNYRTYEITKIHMAEDYDCKMVTAPCDAITPFQREEFSRMAIKVATLLNLRGIMDLEVIDHRGEFKLLEIDARFPSQTPTAVYQTSGMNLVEEMYDLFCFGEFQRPFPGDRYYSSFEHYLWEEGRWHAAGEHIMVEGFPLDYWQGAWGAREVITDFRKDRDPFRVTLIQKEESREQLDKRRAEVCECLRSIR